ncbi:MAG: dethiobiotin synthase [Pirellula sp.]|jgi:dethiobiotin synthetase|nr:dethiobiotin synthase [Pirellula sp.]
MRCRGVFLTGTDTDVGKTHVGCIIARQLVRQGNRVGAYKPVASGFPVWDGSDGQRLWEATSRNGSPELVSPQRFDAPFAPSVAAGMQGRAVDEQQIFSGVASIAKVCDLLIIEGAGGLLSPVSPRLTNADLAAELAIPAILVANWKLGVVHQVLAALTAADSFHIPVAAIVLSAADGTDPHPSHQVLLAEFLKNRCNNSLASGMGASELTSKPIKPLPELWQNIPLLTLNHDQATFSEDVDWASLFAPIKSVGD